MGDGDDFEDSQFPDNDEFVPYVNGGGVAGHGGARLALWGHVTRVSIDGFTLKCVDETEVAVKLRAAPAVPPSGWVEVWGVAQGRGVLAEEVVAFPEEMTKNIDLEGHKMLARLLTAIEDPWNLGEENGMTGVAPME